MKNELQTLRLFSPLFPHIYRKNEWGDYENEPEELDASELLEYEDESLERIGKEKLPDEGERGQHQAVHRQICAGQPCCCKRYDTAELVDALYTEMTEYSFLTKYIFADGIEEIDINSWRDIEIQYAGGRCEKLWEHFDSPEHCINVLRRMLHVSSTILDDQSPLVVGTLAENIRIAVMKSPSVDVNVGAAASIRIVNPFKGNTEMEQELLGE